MWEQGRTELTTVPDIRVYVADLALEIARTVRDDPAAREWVQRRLEVVAPPVPDSE